ncbi:hypothetical protein [Acetivibrio clariflavus]|uniref:hypothetical protein n=1 Tax=Acetivibrio clariflavus TaxID=288965 RepID=UPI0004B9E5CE|nr:hypothetical protein [Acetivibrio clariflavus]
MEKFDDLNSKFDDLRQCSINFPGDYSEQIALELGEILNISIDTELIKKNDVESDKKVW